jgi:hypothetical protein
MANRTLVLGLMAGIALLGAPAARAQVANPAKEKYFVNVNVGAQLASPSIRFDNHLIPNLIYDETAFLTSTQQVGKGAMFDIGAGYRVWGDVSVGLLFSRFADTESAAVIASVPDPVFFDRRTLVPATVADLKRRETTIAPHAIYVYPLTDKLDLAAALGISVIRLSQEMPIDFTVAAGTQTPTITAVTERKTGVGPYVAVDVIYNLQPRYAVGGFVRYAGAKVDLLVAEGHNVGGMQVGAGIRLRF